MRTIARRLLALGVICTALLFGAAQASAGGPTSVLIASPDTNTAAALYHSDADYQALMDALEPAGEPVAEYGPGNIGPGSINITWLIHDVTVWRVDFVRLDSDGRVLVQTNDSQGGDGVGWEGDDEWHAAADPAAARDVLERAGVLSVADTPAAKSAADAKVDETTPVASDSQDGSTGVLAGWWWLLPGAAVGIALGLGARPLATELARRRELGPRHQLIG